MISKHNIWFLLELMRGLHRSVFEDTVESYVKEFLEGWYSREKQVPQWVTDAIGLAGFDFKLYQNS